MPSRAYRPYIAGKAARLHHPNTAALAKTSKIKVPTSKRARGSGRDQRGPYLPPEDWHEPRDNPHGYRVVHQPPGAGYRHVLTEDEVRARLSRLPKEFVEPLQVVQFSRMTRKKLSFPCYGMQWGSAIYLYPIEANLTEYYTKPPTPAQVIEARQHGCEWEQYAAEGWRLCWTLEAIKDFYLNNVLIHELGHLLDERNSSYVDRERFAEAFALQHGYLPTRNVQPKQVVRRHHGC